MTEPKKFNELSADDQKFVKSRQLQGSKLPRLWVGAFSVLAGYDKEADKKRRTVGVVAILCLIGIIPGAIVATKLSPTDASAAIGAAIPALPGVAFAVWWWILRGVDLPNQFRDFVYPFVSLLSEDNAEGAPMRLKLDLRGFDQGPAITGKEYLNGREVKVKKWRDTWFRGAMKMHDGSTLEWLMIDEVKRISFWKRSRSGKMKHKVKFKTRREVLVTLGVRSDTYAPAQNVQNGKLKPGQKRNTFTLRRKFKTAGKPATMQMDGVLGLVADAYKAIAPTAGGAS